MALRFQDKTAIITGAASGIGRACVMRFLQDGTRVVATDIHAEGLEALVATTDTGAGELVMIAGDVTQREDVARIVARAINAYGRLDVLVNAAGITARNVREEVDFAERWEAVMQVNVKGTLLMCHAAVEAMRRTGTGAIVNLTSVMGSVGYPTFLPFSDGFNAYPQSKGAVSQMTRDMDVRLAAEGIRVNAVAPDLILGTNFHNTHTTPESARYTIDHQIPLGRAGTSEDVARALVFLAAEYDGFMTGATLDINGGQYMM